MSRGRRLIVPNVGWASVSHRMLTAVEAKRAGYEAHVATALDPRLDVGTEKVLSEAGLAAPLVDVWDVELAEFRSRRIGNVS